MSPDPLYPPSERRARASGPSEETPRPGGRGAPREPGGRPPDHRARVVMTDIQATKPHLSRDHLLSLLRAMVRIRRFEEKCGELYQQEKIRGFMHLYIGEEAIAVGAMQALAPADAVVPTYREHGHALARGVAMDAVMAEMYGKA